jgi:mannose/fructose/N-acetylgalactosamine-specific phosphotransferase system component IID
MENRLTKKELRQIWKRWGFTHLSSMSYEKLQAHAWAYSYLPFAEKYYKNDEEAKRRLLLRHSMFYNTEPQTGQLINGIVASLEEEIAIGGDVPEEMPVNIKTTLMGPLAGIGESLYQSYCQLVWG